MLFTIKYYDYCDLITKFWLGPLKRNTPFSKYFHANVYEIIVCILYSVTEKKVFLLIKFPLKQNSKGCMENFYCKCVNLYANE